MSEEIPQDPSSSTVDPPRPSGSETSGRLQARGPSAGVLVKLTAPSIENTSYIQLFNTLLDEEISIEVVQLNAGEYLAIIFMYFIHNRAVEGRLALVRALERYRDHPVLLSISNIAESLAEDNLSAALLELHEFKVDASFEPYLTELKNRILSRRLRQIIRAYSAISLKDFSQSLGFAEPNAKVQEILQKLQWPVSADQFVEPKDTEAFKNLLKSICSEEFAPLELDKEKKAKETNKFSVEALQRLAKYADLLDRPL
ncbi:hypothetical protein M3Y97_00694000 [Aphelenchoides bicaudatus]|nr:hypothetical protein M3Y97_00694000 [Aphelenchoides bicaudatus]